MLGTVFCLFLGRLLRNTRMNKTVNRVHQMTHLCNILVIHLQIIPEIEVVHCLRFSLQMATLVHFLGASFGEQNVTEISYKLGLSNS